MFKINSLPLVLAIFGGGVALFGCEKLPPASIAPKLAATAASKDGAPAYTPAQKAWLNFVAKVRRGEQVDPTGQYVKDGTMIAADAGMAGPKRPKLDAARDKFPFALYADGSYVLLPKKSQTSAPSLTAPPDDPIMNCPGNTNCPVYGVVTSTFVTSVGQGGSGSIVDLKVTINKPTLQGYTILDSDLNKGAGGSNIYYHFTRDPNSVEQGLEYDKGSGYSTGMPVVRYKTANGSFWGQPDRPNYFWPIWSPNQNSNGHWDVVDLNIGAGGEYIYSYASKDSNALSSGGGNTYYSGFTEIGIISGNSDQIQPPTGWKRDDADLNEGAGGDHIYFCYKR